MRDKLLIINDALGIAIFTAIFISFFRRWLLPWIAIPCMLWLIIEAYTVMKSGPSFTRTFGFIADVLIATAFVFLPLFVPPSPLNVPAVLTTVLNAMVFSVPPLGIVRNAIDIIDVLNRESHTIVL